MGQRGGCRFKDRHALAQRVLENSKLRSQLLAQSEKPNGLIEGSAYGNSTAVEFDAWVMTPQMAVSNGSCIRAESVETV